MYAMKAFPAHWDDIGLQSQAIAELHSAGLQFWGWTVDSEVAFRGAAALGLDAVTTNRCDFAH